MRFYLLSLVLLFIVPELYAQQGPAENIVIVTLDGFRWQEVFGGADQVLINSTAYVRDTGDLKNKYQAATPQERRQKLLPFFWNTIATQGQLHGNRQYNSRIDVKNPYRFSYPGYNEIFTGYPDTLVNSNDKNPNKNKTVLEFINQQPGYKGKVAAFTSWDCFDAILNEPRAGFLVSSGLDTVKINRPAFELLNEMQFQAFLPFGDGVRPDYLTYFMAKEYMKEFSPKVVFIGFDGTDDYAHGGHYDEYLEQAHMTDQWLADLWQMIQHMPAYKDKTTLLVMCDHGRGDVIKSQWRSHGTDVEGAQEIWVAALGPGIKPLGEIRTAEQLYQAQAAQTIAHLLGFDFIANHPIDKAFPFIQ